MVAARSSETVDKLPEEIRLRVGTDSTEKNWWQAEKKKLAARGPVPVKR